MSRAQALSLHLRHSSFWFSKLSITSPTSQLILQPFPRITYVTTHSPTLLSPLYITGFSLTSPGEPPMHRGMENSLWWTSLLQQVNKFRSSYSFGELLRILLLAVYLFSFSHIVSSDSSFNIHNAVYFVEIPFPGRTKPVRGPQAARGPRVEDPWYTVLCNETIMLVIKTRAF